MNKSSSNSSGREPNIAAVIDNNVSRCHLLDVSKVPLPADIKSRQYEHGPYVVLQKGAMPGDLYSKPFDFLLTREGRWLGMFAFLKLADQERFELCVFNTAAEAIQQLEQLSGRVRIDEERIARARDVERRSTPAKKLNVPDPSARTSDAILPQGED